jgi:hypothetical protein
MSNTHGDHGYTFGADDDLLELLRMLKNSFERLSDGRWTLDGKLLDFKDDELEYMEAIFQDALKSRYITPEGEITALGHATLFIDQIQQTGSGREQASDKETTFAPSPINNSVVAIEPYWAKGTWVFDDPRTGLVQEPFVAGIPEMINTLVENIPNAGEGFQLLFSSNPIPGYQKKVVWVRAESGGNWYREADSQMEGWLCPALFCYFEQAPKELYVIAQPLNSRITTRELSFAGFGREGEDDSDRILALLADNPPLRAREIARQVGLEKSQVNSILYGRLSGAVVKNYEDCWSLRD